MVTIKRIENLVYYFVFKKIMIATTDVLTTTLPLLEFGFSLKARTMRLVSFFFIEKKMYNVSVSVSI